MTIASSIPFVYRRSLDKKISFFMGTDLFLHNLAVLYSKCVVLDQFVPCFFPGSGPRSMKNHAILNCSRVQESHATAIQPTKRHQLARLNGWPENNRLPLQVRRPGRCVRHRQASEKKDHVLVAARPKTKLSFNFFSPEQQYICKCGW